MVQGVHVPTEQVNLGEQLYMLTDRNSHMTSVSSLGLIKSFWGQVTYLLQLLLELPFLSGIQVEGRTNHAW